MAQTVINERVAAARAGTNPTVICRMSSGWVVLGDVQYLPGCCLLLADPVVPDLNALDVAGRTRFLLDMTIVGDALLEVTGAFRINYEILGNTAPALHAFIFPRYMSEPENLRRAPVFLYEREKTPPPLFDAARDKKLMQDIAAAIKKRLE